MGDGRATDQLFGCGRTVEQVRAAFPAAYQNRLLEIKRTVDPDDMFRFGNPIGIG